MVNGKWKNLHSLSTFHSPLSTKMSSFFNNYFFIILAILAGAMMPTQNDCRANVDNFGD